MDARVWVMSTAAGSIPFHTAADPPAAAKDPRENYIAQEVQSIKDCLEAGAKRMSDVDD